MAFVDVRCNDVGELIVGHPGGQLFSNLVCFLRRDLFGFESLPNVIADYVKIGAKWKHFCEIFSIGWFPPLGVTVF